MFEQPVEHLREQPQPDGRPRDEDEHVDDVEGEQGVERGFVEPHRLQQKRAADAG